MRHILCYRVVSTELRDRHNDKRSSDFPSCNAAWKRNKRVEPTERSQGVAKAHRMLSKQRSVAQCQRHGVACHDWNRLMVWISSKSTCNLSSSILTRLGATNQREKRKSVLG